MRKCLRLSDIVLLLVSLGNSKKYRYYRYYLHVPVRKVRLRESK